MSDSSRRLCFLLFALFLLPLAPALGQGSPSGPDVEVVDIPDVANYGSIGSTAAWSFGTVACNVGTQPLNWVGWTNQHPVIIHNLYRLKDDRFEQVGMSWASHAFAALNGSACGNCTPGSLSTLGPGCSDTLTALQNGNQLGLGPRSEIDPLTVNFPFPPVLVGALAQPVDRRLQADHADVDPALNTGATWFVEAQYLAADDAAAGNSTNNASYREVTVTANGPGFDLALASTTQKNLQAVNAWQAADTSVIIEHVDVQGDGRFTVAFKAVPLPTGFTRYEYAVHNLDVERSAGAVAVAVPVGATIQNPGFHDVPYHSGEPWSGTDWTSTITNNGIRWATTDFATDPNANALRWGTLYNFWFESDTAPGVVTIELFKPGSPASVIATSMASCPPAPAPQSVYDYTLAPSPAYDEVFIVPVSISPPPLASGMAATVPLGFSFPFFTETLTEIQIGPRGYLSMVGEPGDVALNQQLPHPLQPNGVIAGYWDDLDPSLGGVVRHANLGTSPNQRFVVEYFNVPHAADPTQVETFQISLYESGRITTSWVASGQLGVSATVGLEGPAGNRGLTVGFNAGGVVVPGTSVEYVRTLLGNTTAELLVSGDGTAGTQVGIQILGVPQKPFLLMGDADRGPTPIGGAWPPLDIGFSPAFILFVDGPGVLGPPDPVGMTDGCGLWSVFFTSPLPSGFDYTLQAVVVEQFAPTPLLHVSNSHRIIVP